jgi:peptidoglycan hydrolase-like protein with peptidoglycan-binding domain
VLNDARTERIDLPAQYKTVQVDKQVEPEKEIRHVIPAEYKTLNLSKIDKEGYMEWRSILCETNMTTSRIKNIQTALLNRGHHPGPIDGIVGRKTMRAVNAFQAENNLPSDQYLNMETVNALNIQ